MKLDFEFIIASLPAMFKAIPVTLYMTGLALLLGLTLGFFIALLRLYKVPVLSRLFIILVTLIRSTPIIVQLYIAFYAIPLIVAAAFPSVDIGLLPSMLFAITALTLNYSAYMSETLRSAILSVDKGQMEAANSVGMTNAYGMFRIVLPQAAVVALPNLGNQVIGIIKDTSLTYTVMVMEIMGTAKMLAGQGYNFLETYLIATFLYWGICIGVEKIFIYIESRANHFKQPMPAGS